MTPHIRRVLGGFRHWVAQHVAGNQPCKLNNGRYYYLPLEEAMMVEVLEEMGNYISRHQNKFDQ